jgi:hypothetical protein
MLPGMKHRIKILPLNRRGVLALRETISLRGTDHFPYPKGRALFHDEHHGRSVARENLVDAPFLAPRLFGTPRLLVPFG